MQTYTLSIKPTSPFGTSLESDTIFGHLCWALRYLNEDENKLIEFLGEFNQSKTPPIVISNAFPRGYMPFPNLPPLSMEELDRLKGLFIESRMGNGLDFSQWMKGLSKQRLITIDTFNRFQDHFNKFEIYKKIIEKDICPFRFASKPRETDEKKCKFKENEFMPDTLWHNTISRISGTVLEEGGLYDKEVRFYRPGECMNVFIKSDYFSSSELEELFSFISLNGFGADKSTGNGRFDFEIEEGNPFNDIDEFNRCLLLSNTNADILTRYKAHYTTRTKFGKLGGLFSTNARYSPFKKPLLMLNPGTVVFIHGDKKYEYMGENYNGVYRRWNEEHTEILTPGGMDIQHYGIGYPVKMRLKND